MNGIAYNTHRTVYGREFKTLCNPAGKHEVRTRKTGEKLLINAGFKPCANPSYYKRGECYAHWNSVSKLWYFDN